MPGSTNSPDESRVQDQVKNRVITQDSSEDIEATIVTNDAKKSPYKPAG